MSLIINFRGKNGKDSVSSQLLNYLITEENFDPSLTNAEKTQDLLSMSIGQIDYSRNDLMMSGYSHLQTDLEMAKIILEAGKNKKGLENIDKSMCEKLLTRLEESEQTENSVGEIMRIFSLIKNVSERKENLKTLGIEPLSCIQVVCRSISRSILG
jgi:hypothetical protein